MVELKWAALLAGGLRELTQCKIEASMCHLRGLLMLKLNRGDQAKKCFMEALALDVKCYEAFEQLISGEMMTPIEGANLDELLCASTKHRITRMGVRPVSGVQGANTRRCGVREDDVYIAATQVQACRRARFCPTQTSRRLWPRR